MKRYLVSYWVTGRTQPNNLEVPLDNVSEMQVPLELQKYLADYETYDGDAYYPVAITILNFWRIQ